MENKNIQQYVGENIRKFRLAHGLTLDEVAARIYKSKSTVSKYENGTISLDIATLEDIANALDVLPAQLLMTPCTNKQVPEAQQLVQKMYMYSYDGKSKRILKSVVERYRTTEDNKFSIQLFYDIPDKGNTGDCSALYQGICNIYEVIENYTLENASHPIEQIWLSCIGGLSHARLQVGFIAGLLNQTLLPAVRKVVLSPTLMTEEELLPYLVFTREDLQSIKKKNVFIIDEFVV